MILQCRYVVPVDAPIIENGAVAVERGRIVAVGTARELAGIQDRDTTDFSQAVLCPGFVNAHTHLELSFLAGQIPPTTDFVDWLRRLSIRLTSRTRSQEQIRDAVRTGLALSLAAGVTTIGDITRTPQWTRKVLAESPAGGVSFGEVIAIGKRRSQLAQRLDAAATPTGADSLLAGISPHAPYTVEPEGLRACAARARRLDAPLCIHLAETTDEELFTRCARGRLADFLREVGVWDEHLPASGCGPVELARRSGLLQRRTLIAHANYVSDADIRLIAAGGASVAYCPRTHHAFGHAPHRFRDMRAAGINVCVATDSLASNPSLSILEELRFLRRAYPALPADELIAMGTLCGARALGLAEAVGSITVGKRADFTVVPLDDTDAPTRWDAIFEAQADPLAVYVAGMRPTGTPPCG